MILERNFGQRKITGYTKNLLSGEQMLQRRLALCKAFFARWIYLLWLLTRGLVRCFTIIVRFESYLLIRNYNCNEHI